MSDPATRSFQAELPQPVLLSLEMNPPKILRDESGLWNKLTADDREHAFRGLRQQAEKQVAESKLLAEALHEAGNRIRELLSPPVPMPPQ